MRTTRTDTAPLLRLAPATPWARWSAAGVALLVAWGVLAVWTPSNDPDATLCLFRRLTHHDCATCGMTRAFAALAKGDLRGALAHHPLSPLLAGEILALWLLAPLAITRRWRVSGRALAMLGWANLTLVLAVWLVRMASGRV